MSLILPPVNERFNGVTLENSHKHDEKQTTLSEMKSNGATTNMESEKSDQAVAALEQMSVSGGAVGKFKKKEKKKKPKKKF